MKHEIDGAEYLQIVGLIALVKPSMDRLKAIEESIRSILQVTKEDEAISGVGDPDHIGDAIYSEYSVGELLQKLGVEYTE